LNIQPICTVEGIDSKRLGTTRSDFFRDFQWDDHAAVQKSQNLKPTRGHRQ